MRLLLDTHLLLWAAGVPEQLPGDARTLIEQPENELVVSAASLWEVTIKRSLGRADFIVEPRQLRRGLLENGYTELAFPELTPLPWMGSRPFMATPSTVSWWRRHRLKP